MPNYRGVRKNVASMREIAAPALQARNDSYYYALFALGGLWSVVGRLPSAVSAQRYSSMAPPQPEPAPAVQP